MTGIRIKDEIRFLHIKKQHLNHQLFRLHLSLADAWGKLWPYIQERIEENLQKIIRSKYKILDNKLLRLTQQQTTTPNKPHPFFPRVVNNTNISFSKTELDLLNKGPKYNLHRKNKQWLTNLALETETAINKLPASDRDYLRTQASDHLTKLKSRHRTQTPTHHSEFKTLRSIKTKLQENDATIASADKGNSLVILPTQQYNTKIQNFIDNNNFQTSTSDPTKNYQNQVRKTINRSTTLIPQEYRWRHINLNPSAPSIKGLIKLHKTDQPIRPVVNWRNAPAYKLARHFSSLITRHAPLPNTFNIKNTSSLIQELQQTPISPTATFASLDVTNMYSNIPVSQTKHILDNILHLNQTDTRIKTELLDWYETITHQNYFRHNDKTITQTDGLAMGAPSSSIISEIFLQHIEHTHLPHLTRKHQLVNYARYVDDILLIFDSQHTNLPSILHDFNSLHQNLHFTGEAEQNNAISYLDITINKTPSNIKISVFRKPTFTDTIIPYTSNHPTQHKFAAVRFLYNRLNSYQLQPAEYRREENTIHNILHNNSFPILPQKTIPKNPPHPQRNPATQSWAVFTYTGKETTYITKLFRHTNIKIAYRTNNNLLRHLTPNPQPLDPLTRSGVYRLSCPDCSKAYI